MWINTFSHSSRTSPPLSVFSWKMNFHLQTSHTRLSSFIFLFSSSELSLHSFHTSSSFSALRPIQTSEKMIFFYSRCEVYSYDMSTIQKRAWQCSVLWVGFFIPFSYSWKSILISSIQSKKTYRKIEWNSLQMPRDAHHSHSHSQTSPSSSSISWQTI